MPLNLNAFSIVPILSQKKLVKLISDGDSDRQNKRKNGQVTSQCVISFQFNKAFFREGEVFTWRRNEHLEVVGEARAATALDSNSNKS